MRLTSQEVSVIKSSILRCDPKAKIVLFGSRVHDDKRGGDIDLLILSDSLTFPDKARIKHAIFESLEEQRIDITISNDLTDPFVQIALKEGIFL